MPDLDPKVTIVGLSLEELCSDSGQVLLNNSLQLTFPYLMSIEMLIGVLEYHVSPVETEDANSDDGQEDIETKGPCMKWIAGSCGQGRSLFSQGRCSP